ncbi:TauD/TfdA dioxygenase family protein [Novosphingobium mangrovi (ex Huang et al. 2023)]|uniref:TauD/TfdA family dioxygenase n=1 Tax=Novosphingobium mangrovi (ex Huang et al. 2023) TaxID=2976432 RepID=A0ABT2I4R6_9SPHN|nr:TauD/TfdA family dioxygenase [Novosphingobium mangrovi (ex Huang et al. 2023)]MCT2399803.1 TauD/TfdA family dioxygenase [Novosphingobium mangrovi (ex Huang et al. 2023)]
MLFIGECSGGKGGWNLASLCATFHAPGQQDNYGRGAIKFQPLHRDFDVEVLGFDTRKGGIPDEIERLRATWDEHGLLLFRGSGPLSPEHQLEIASWFGPLPVANSGAGSGTGDFVRVLHNDDAAGSVVLPFHSDLTYTDHPIRGICLQAARRPGTISAEAGSGLPNR